MFRRYLTSACSLLAVLAIAAEGICAPLFLAGCECFACTNTESAEGQACCEVDAATYCQLLPAACCMSSQALPFQESCCCAASSAPAPKNSEVFNPTVAKTFAFGPDCPLPKHFELASLGILPDGSLLHSPVPPRILYCVWRI